MYDDAHSLTYALGGQWRGSYGIARCVSHDDRNPSLSIRDSKMLGRLLLKCHAGCDLRDIVAELRRLGFLGTSNPGHVKIGRGGEHHPPDEDDLVRIKRAQRLWQEAEDPRGTAAERYLNARKLELSVAIAGFALRFHPRCPWHNQNTNQTERVPALLAAFREIVGNNVTGVHRIRLDRPSAWPKVERRMLGVVSRSAIKLDLTAERELVVGEGVETVLAGRQLGYGPAWAMGSVGALSFVPLLPGINRLVILGETGEASARAIEILGRRWYNAGRLVRIIEPDPGFSDLNDELMASAS